MTTITIDPNECAAQRRLRHSDRHRRRERRGQSIRTSAPLKGDCDKRGARRPLEYDSSNPNECAAQRRLRHRNPLAVVGAVAGGSERVRRSKAIATRRGHRRACARRAHPNECAAQRRLRLLYRRCDDLGSGGSERVRRSKAIATLDCGVGEDRLSLIRTSAPLKGDCDFHSS